MSEGQRTSQAPVPGRIRIWLRDTGQETLAWVRSTAENWLNSRSKPRVLLEIAIALVLVTVLLPPFFSVLAGVMRCNLGDCAVVEASAFKLVSGIVVGTGGGLALYFAARRANAQVRAAEAQARATDNQTQEMERNREQLELTRRDHLSRRFTESIKQLGDSDSAPIRIGGIVGLWSIAEESKEVADVFMVFDVLSAYLRMRGGECKLAYKNGIISAEDYVVPQEEQHIINRIAFMKNNFRVRDGGSVPLFAYSFDLRGIFLPNVNCDDGDFASFNFASSVLRGASFRSCNLDCTTFVASDLFNIDFSYAICREARFYGANMAHAGLDRSVFSRSILMEVNFTDASMGGIDLTNANLSGAKLNRAFLCESIWKGAKLFEADLRGADLTGAQISRSQILQARTDDTTILPDSSLLDEAEAADTETACQVASSSH